MGHANLALANSRQCSSHGGNVGSSAEEVCASSAAACSSVNTSLQAVP